MDFNLDRLRSFIVVARTGNLSAAAKELGTTQPNLGRQMTALEKEVNLILFARHSRGLSLTKQGQDFLALCQDIVGRLAQGTVLIREKDSDPTGEFNFVCGPGLLELILENIQLFCKKFPNIHLHFFPSINAYHLQIGEADAAVMVERVNDSELIQRPLYEAAIRIYASPEYFKTNPMPVTLEDLQHHKLIFYGGERDSFWNGQILSKLTSHLSLQPFIEVPSAPAMRTALLSGVGIGCYAYNQTLINQGLLIDVFPHMHNHNECFYYTYHKRLEGSPKIDAFYAFSKGLTLINKGKNPLWINTVLYGYPKEAPKAVEKGIKIKKSYYTLSGQEIKLNNKTSLTQGDQLIVVVSGELPQPLSPEVVNYLLFVDWLPAGFEIESGRFGMLPTIKDTQAQADAQNNSNVAPTSSHEDRTFSFRFDGSTATKDAASSTQAVKKYPWDDLTKTLHTELRDDRFVAAIKLTDGARTFTLAYRIRAVTPGFYVYSGLHVEDMFIPTIYANTGGGTVEIKGKG